MDMDSAERGGVEWVSEFCPVKASTQHRPAPTIPARQGGADGRHLSKARLPKDRATKPRQVQLLTTHSLNARQISAFPTLPIRHCLIGNYFHFAFNATSYLPYMWPCLHLPTCILILPSLPCIPLSRHLPSILFKV